MGQDENDFDTSKTPLSKEAIEKIAKSQLAAYDCHFIIQAVSQCLDDLGIIGENFLTEFTTRDKEYTLATEPTDHRFSTILKEAQNLEWTGRTQKAIDAANTLSKILGSSAKSDLNFPAGTDEIIIENADLIRDAYSVFSALSSVNAFQEKIKLGLASEKPDIDGITTQLESLEMFAKVAEDSIKTLVANPGFKINVVHYKHNEKNDVNPEFEHYERRIRQPSATTTMIHRLSFTLPPPPPIDFINDIRAVLRSVNVLVAMAEGEDKLELKEMQVNLLKILAAAQRPHFKLDLDSDMQGLSLRTILEKTKNDLHVKKEKIWDPKKAERHASEDEQVTKGMSALENGIVHTLEHKKRRFTFSRND